MSEEELRKLVAVNLVHYRKLANLTQGQLAELINYSDKSVSKWERAEGIPDLFVMTKIAELYNITVNDLLTPNPQKRIPDVRKQKILVTLLSVGIVWLVAVTVFSVLNIINPAMPKLWLCYIYAIPVTAIVVLVFSSVWGNKIVWCISTTVLIWGLLSAIYLTVLNPSYWSLFLIGIPLQALTIMWFFFRSVFVKVMDRMDPKRTKK